MLSLREVTLPKVKLASEWQSCDSDSRMYDCRQGMVSVSFAPWMSLFFRWQKLPVL